jgi:membrane-associated phospholipid phosphatase
MRVLSSLSIILLLAFAFCAQPCAAQQDSLTPTITTTLLHTANNLDERLLIQINHWAEKAGWLNYPAELLSNSAVYTVLGIPAGLFLYGLATKNTPHSYAGVSTLLSVGISGLLTEGIKQIVQRQRPYCTLDSCVFPDTLVLGYSFPSGHATASWALATGLSLHYPKWYVIGPSILYAGAVSLARPSLAVHYPSDILAGAIIGAATSYFFWRNENRWFHNGGNLLNPGGIPPSMIAPENDPKHVSFAFNLPIGF